MKKYIANLSIYLLFPLAALLSACTGSSSNSGRGIEAVVKSLAVVSLPGFSSQASFSPNGDVTIALGGWANYQLQATYTNGVTETVTQGVSAGSNTAAFQINNVGVFNNFSFGLYPTIGSGSSTITVTYKGKSVTFTATAAPGGTVATGPLTLNSVSVTAPNMPAGVSNQATVTGSFSNGGWQDLTSLATWSSSNPGVATVSPTGLITGKAAGTSTITAAVGGTSASATLNVTAATLSSVSVVTGNSMFNTTFSSVPAGVAVPWSAWGSYTDNSRWDISNLATWSSSNTAFATISTTGLATAVSAGTATITATVGVAPTTTGTLTVTAPTLQSIAISPASPALATGLSQPFTVTGTYSDASTWDISKSVTWSSSNAAVATVNAQGVVTGVSPGSATITAKYGLIQGTAAATVAASVQMGGGKLASSPANGGVVTTLAGSGTAGATDGTGAAASFSSPGSVATDGTNLYIADSASNKIRQVVIATGAVTTLAGSGAVGAADGTGTAASFNNPVAITTDGTNLYVADSGNNKIRKIVIATGAVTTLAGSGAVGAVNGTGATATFNGLSGITTDGVNLYATETNNNLIRKVVIATAAVTTFAGSGAAGLTDGTGTTASFNTPRGVTMDGTNLYVADSGNNAIRIIGIGSATVFTMGRAGTGPATSMIWLEGGTWQTWAGPAGVATDGANLYVADTANNKIRKVALSTLTVTTLAGSGAGSATDGTGAAASFNAPAGIATDGTSVYVADTASNKIRQIK